MAEVKGPVFRGHGGHCSPVVALQFSSTTPPQVLASVGLDGQIVCFDLAGGPPLEGLWQEELGSTSKPGEEIEKVRNTGASVSGSGVAPTQLPERYVAQAPGRRLLAVSSPNTNEIRLAELPLSFEGVHHRAHGARITGLAWCDQETLMSITSSRSIARWRVASQPQEKPAQKKAAFAPPSRVVASANSTQTISSADVAPSAEKENDQDFNGTATVDKHFFEKLGVGKKDKDDVPDWRMQMMNVGNDVHLHGSGCIPEPEEDMRSTQPLSVGAAAVPDYYEEKKPYYAEDMQSTQPLQASGRRADLPPPWAVDSDLPARPGSASGSDGPFRACRRPEP